MSYAPRTHWDRFFMTLLQSGDDLDWGDQWTAPSIQPLRQADVRSVLDLGCGTGNEVFRLLKEGFDVTGLDFSEEAIARALVRLEDRRRSAGRSLRSGHRCALQARLARNSVPPVDVARYVGYSHSSDIDTW